jgi:hypothetical protein
MSKLKKLVIEAITKYKKPAKKSCSCGCNTCDTGKAKSISLNENLAPKEILSEGLKYHMDKKQPLTENVYRAGSERYFDLWSEARALYSRGIIEVQNQDDLEILTETHLGEFGIIYEIEIGDKVQASKEYGGSSGEVVDIKGSFVVIKTKEGNKSYHESDLKVLNKEGKKIPLDFIMEEEQEENTKFNINKVWDFIGSRPFYNKDYMPEFNTAEEIWDEWGPEEKQMYSNFEWENTYGDKLHPRELVTRQRQANYNALAGLNEAKDKKKTPPIGKPKRGGSKKFYVYVRDKGKIKKVSFGDTSGLSAKINNPEARRAFAKRHDCANKKDRTKASYWSCRLPRYAKLLGLKSNFSGFW